MNKREDFRTNPRFLARIITDAIYLDLIRVQEKKNMYFLDVLILLRIETIISKNVVLILKDKRHFYSVLQG